MKTLRLREAILSVDYAKGHIDSLMIQGKERLASRLPLFAVCLRDKNGKAVVYTAYDAKSCVETEDGAIYKDFGEVGFSVQVHLNIESEEAAWRISVSLETNDFFVEWVDFPKINLPILADNNTEQNGGRILFPYNEGVLVSDLNLREGSIFAHKDAEYPSQGWFAVFPNMVCSQMLAYLWNDVGLYIGAHDKKRGVKEIDFLREADGVTLRFRLFCGTDFGEEFSTDYSIIFSMIDGAWEAAAERYRAWFEGALPKKVKKISENRDLPEWYEESPLIVSYPVRGVHDMDEMKPNKLYPYTRAIPLIDEIREACDNRLLVLLMHWEGTAPWAPPYVWPPFGGEDNFNDFIRLLHDKGDRLGVYCSGFGYTIQSNLIAEYNNEDKYNERKLWRGMCVGEEGRVSISKICTGQRSGYDICPASDVGRALLKEAYEPLFKSKVDYAQILDQNHGGGQYFCYGREHGHAPAPGPWMTENMQKMLSEWNNVAGETLFGCESAAAEPFIGNLLFSDNRFELNYHFGVPVPLYAYVYHEYVRNFMGNQVCCPFSSKDDTLRYRLAYSFSIGDCMTVVLTEEGELMSEWGMRDFSHLPDKEKAFRLIKNLSRFYKEKAKMYLYDGRMIATPAIECETLTYSAGQARDKIKLPAILSSAWTGKDGSRVVILVNPEDKTAHCKINGTEISVSPLNAVMLEV